MTTSRKLCREPLCGRLATHSGRCRECYERRTYLRAQREFTSPLAEAKEEVERMMRDSRGD